MGFAACCGCTCWRAEDLQHSAEAPPGRGGASDGRGTPQGAGNRGASPHTHRLSRDPAAAAREEGGSPRPPLPSRISPQAANSNALPALMEWAARLGLTGHLDGDAGEARVDGESDLAARLRRDVRKRARETLDAGRLTTALAWCDDFVTDTGRSPLFKRLEHAGDLGAMVYNQTTLDMLAEYIRQRGSRRPGNKRAVLRSDTIQTYVATIKLLRGSEAHYNITCPQVNVVAPAAHKRMRQQDGAPGSRGLCRGMRTHMLRELVRRGWDRSSRSGAVAWAAALTAHNLLLRGGEVGSVDKKPFDTSRDITIGAVEFMAANAESEGMPWLTVDVVPIKDTVARKRVCPMPVRRRSRGGSLGDDPLDVYDAIILAIRARTGRLPPKVGRVGGLDGLAPLFVKARGGEWRSADSRALTQRMAAGLARARSGRLWRQVIPHRWRDRLARRARRVQGGAHHQAARPLGLGHPQDLRARART